jgi:hypothetical protein
MNRVIPPRAGTGKGRLLLALLLPPLVTGISQYSVPPITHAEGADYPRPEEEARTYLHVVGPPPLRFEEPEVVPQKDVSTRPPPGAPPPPPSIEKSGHASIMDVLLAPGWNGMTDHPSKPESKKAKSSSTAPKAGAPAILPDDGASRVHPEDFLPFFQFPEAARNGGTESYGIPTPAAPGQLPPSRATYQQE